MKEYPILFTTNLVEAILGGRKNQTRRIVKPQPTFLDESGWPWQLKKAGPVPYNFKYGQQGDMLWVRETYMKASWPNGTGERKTITHFKAGAEIPVYENKWKASIHMPKADARIWLEITKVKSESLQNVSESDAMAEGIVYNSTFKMYECPVCNVKGGHSGAGIDFLCEDGFYISAKKAFQALWISINGIESWYEDPLVWVIDFSVASTTGKAFITNDWHKGVKL